MLTLMLETLGLVSDSRVDPSYGLLLIQPLFSEGLMPISGDKNETRKLFFWFWPVKDPKHTDDLV